MLWKLKAGEVEREDGGNRNKTFLFGQMDELAKGGVPLVIETESDKALDAAAEYAAEKGYDLAATTPEQNLRILEKQKQVTREDVDGGELGPSVQQQQREPVAPAKKKDEPEKSTAEILKDWPTLKPEPLDKQTKPLFPHKDPPDIPVRTKRGYPAIKDHGDKIRVTRIAMLAVTPPQKRDRDEILKAALVQARGRYGEPVRVSGGKAFEAGIVRLAVEQGMPLEMASERGKKLYQEALLAKEKQKQVSLGEAGSLGPAKQRQKEKERGGPSIA
ncbi:LPD7 domain-containing protein [Acidithiobacillus caldus]|uniref:LPD7 domain-containing protein n=1 Tax=Acidithiobacillus caldus TaxID=33059 RepID=UPI0007DA350B|nr:LPD7 domain-containing protein [Acidithiobacillus caldus]QER45287.1 hypothetical protein F0726_02230 [Acidithiobacillus caldus]